MNCFKGLMSCWRMSVCLVLVMQLALHAQTVLNVTNYGAVGDGVTDDFPAFVAAINAAAAISPAPVVLQVPDGSYKLALPQDADSSAAHLKISSLSNLTIEAPNEAILVCGSPYHHGIYINASDHITLRNLSVDYDPLPHTQGTVVATTPASHYVDITIDAGFPLPTEDHIDTFGGEHTGKNVGYLYDPYTGKKLNQFMDQYLNSQVIDLGSGVYRYVTSNTVLEDFVGKKFIVVGRRKADAVKINSSSDCLAENVTIYSAPATAFNISSSGLVTVDQCTITQKPNTTRLFSTNADGVHSKWCTVGPVVSHCYFTGMGDDSVNIGGSFVPVIKVEDAYTIYTESHGSLYNVADDFVYMDKTTHELISLGPISSINVTSIPEYASSVMKIVFTNPVPNFVTWLTTQNLRSCSQICNLNASGRGAQVVNNHFYNHRARGVLMRAPDALIQGNHFDTLAGPAVIISNDSSFLSEGPSGNGTQVLDNTFTNIERSNIWIQSSGDGSDTTATKGVTDLVIDNNTFDDYGGRNAYGRGTVGNVFYIRNAPDCQITNNTIGKPAFEQEPIVVFEENFDGYADDAALRAVWQNAVPTTPNNASAYVSSSFTSSPSGYSTTLTSQASKHRNGLNYCELGTTVTEDFTLRFKMIQSNFSRYNMVGLLNADGTQGYAVGWSTASATSYNGNGYVQIKKIDLTSSWDSFFTTGTTISSNMDTGHPATGYAVTGTDPVTYDNTFAGLAQIDMTWDASTGLITVYVNGQEKLSVTDTDFASFSRIYVRGNEYSLVDDIKLTTMSYPDMPIISSLTENMNWNNNTRTDGVMVDMDDYTIVSYSADQDDAAGKSSSATVSDGGLTVELQGNAWKRIPLTYAVTPNTILEFEVTASDIGEIIGIGLDEDNNHGNDLRCFQLGGTQAWTGMFQETNTYSSGVMTCRIPVGQFYTGTMSNLCFVADDDADGSTQVQFKAVMLYEDE